MSGSSSSSTISPELLQALLSPNGSIRSQAESVFQSLSVLDRIQGVLLQLSSSAAATTSATSSTGTADINAAIALLAAVLLRRDIVKLSSAQHLVELVQPLLQIFFLQEQADDQQQRRSSCPRLQVGHCLAEVCASLTLVQPDAVPGVLTSILTVLQASCQQGNVPSLQLLAALADKAPMAFTELAVDSSLPSLYYSNNNNNNNNNFNNNGWSSSPATMHAWTQVLVNAASATLVQENPVIGRTSAAPPSNLDDWTVDPQSRAARLAPSVLPVLEWLHHHSTSNSNDEACAMSILQELAHAAVSCPSFLAGNPQVLSTCIQTCLQVATTTTTTTATTTTSTSLQLAALQVVSSLISVGDVKRRCLPAELAHTIATHALPLCAQIMLDHAGDAEDDAAWAEEPASLVQDGMDDDDDGDDGEYLFATMLFSSFLADLGALAVVLPLVESLLQDPKNNASRARVGLALLDCALTSTPVSLTPHLPVVLQAATTLAAASSSSSGSSSPRTQYQAIRLLGGLCVSHSEVILHPSSPWSKIVLERLAGALASPCTKVSATTSEALVSFCRADGSEHSKEHVAESLAPFLADLLTVLIQGPLSWTGTDQGSVTVRVRAIGATACLAQASGGGEAFGPSSYNRVMPGLLATCQLNSVDLAGAAIEAATLIGQAVGKETFQSDAHQLLQQWILPVLQQQQQQSDDGDFSALLEPLLLACARIASVLEEDFAPYVDSVLPLLLSRVQQPPDVSIVEGDEAGLNAPIEDDQGIESRTIALPGRGFTKVTINTTKIQEKAQAIRALYEHAKALGAAFGPYAEHCMEALLPLVNFPYSSDVRSTAAQTLGAVFDASCLAGEEIGMALPRKYLPLLAKAISTQVAEEGTADMDALYALADSLSEVYYIAYRYRTSHSEILAHFGLSDAQTSVEACMKSMVLCLERRAQITRVLGGALTGEDEKQDYLGQLEAEQQLLTPLVDSVGYTLKFFRQDFVPLFEQYIVPGLGPKLEDQSDVRASLSAICLFDDVVEHCGAQAAAQYAPRLMQGVATTFDQHADEKDLVQAAVYGIAQMARYAPSGIMSSHIQTIVHRLLALTSRSKEDAEDDVYLIEIAASALASLTLLGPFQDLKFVPRDTLVDAFLSQLPILQDYDEAKICHAGLCHLIENGTIPLDQEAVRLIRIIGDILVEVQEGEDVATPDTVERMSSILFQMQEGLAPSTLQQALGALGPEAQQIVGSVVQQVGISRSHVVTP